MEAKTEAAATTDLMFIVNAVSGSVIWRADHQVTHKAAPATQAERDGQRAPCWVESLRQSRNRVAGAIRVVVIVLVAKADRMREAARSRIQSEGNLVGVVLVGKRRKLDAAQTSAGNARIRIVGKAKEGAERAGQVPIQPSQRHVFVIGKRPSAGELRKARNVGGHGGILVVAFVAHEPEQAITHEGTTNVEACLLAVEGGGLLPDAGGERVVPPEEKCAAVHLVASALGHDVDGPTAGQTCGNIRGGAANLILLNGIRGNVLRHGAEVFVGDVQTVHRHTRGDARLARHAQHRVGALSGCRVDLYAGFELAEVEEVAAVEWQLSKQLLGDNPFERRLLEIHAYRVGLHSDCLTDITDLQPHVGCCHSTDFSLEFNNRLFESRCFHAELVEARLKRGSAVDACRGSE